MNNIVENITKGDWYQQEGTFSVWHPTEIGVRLCVTDLQFNHTIGENDEEALANAKLIADAGTTANKCKKLPSELLAENNELLEILTKIMEGFVTHPINDYIESYQKTISKAREIIQK